MKMLVLVLSSGSRRFIALDKLFVTLKNLFGETEVSGELNRNEGRKLKPKLNVGVIPLNCVLMVLVDRGV